MSSNQLPPLYHPIRFLGEFMREKANSSMAFIMVVYSHIIEGMQEEAMKLLDEVLPSGNIQKAITTI